MSQYPLPPRPVRWMDLLGVYGPMLAYTAMLIVVLLAATGLLGHAVISPKLLAMGAVVVLGYGTLTASILLVVSSALRKGVYANAEVLPGGGSRARVELSGQTVEVTLGSRRSYRPGERIGVLLDPNKKTVLLVVGAAS